jgi:hypothetical protein
MQRLWQCSFCFESVAVVPLLTFRRADSPIRVLLVEDLERGLRALAIELG